MFGNYFYLPAADGRRYCWAKEPTFRCPVGSTEALGDALEVACGEMGVDRTWMLRRIKHSAGRRRENGRLTNRCATCGHTLERLGFAYWVEQVKDATGVGDKINERLGFGPPVEHIGPTRYADTKREARQWAYEQDELAANIKREEVG